MELDGRVGELVALLHIGDLGKPFHRPECECYSCEDWRKHKGLETRSSMRQELKQLRGE